VDFDPDRFVPPIRRAVTLRDAFVDKLRVAGDPDDLSGDAATFRPASDLAGMISQGEDHGIGSYPAADADVLSLKHTLLYGMKGLAAYADHALILGLHPSTLRARMYKFGIVCPETREPD
jgi:hydroxylamine reductase